MPVFSLYVFAMVRRYSADSNCAMHCANSAPAVERTGGSAVGDPFLIASGGECHVFYWDSADNQVHLSRADSDGHLVDLTPASVDLTAAFADTSRVFYRTPTTTSSKSSTTRDGSLA